MNILLSALAIIAFVVIGLLLSGMILWTKAKLVSKKPCRILINDDESLEKQSPAGVTLLGALSANEIAIPSPCGGKATCKQCRVQITSGKEPPLEPDKATFTPKELEEGWRLSCQCKLRGDVGIKIPESYLELKVFKGKVVSNKNVATFIKELVIQVPQDFVKYQPGDYLQFHVPKFSTNTENWKVTMEKKYFSDWDKFAMFGKEIDYSSLPEEVIRAYSMASFPDEKEVLKFNVRIATPPLDKGRVSTKVPWGICSSYTFSLKEGDEVTLSGPFGESHMIHDDKELIFLIGGAGSSFGRSHIMDLFMTKKTKRRVSLWYGARSLKENIYEEDFKTLEKEHENFSYNLVLSEPLPEDFEQGWEKDNPVKTNFLFKAFEEGQLKNMEEPEECYYYVCGPPLHNMSIMNLLDSYGVPEKNIILDDFGS